VRTASRAASLTGDPTAYIADSANPVATSFGAALHKQVVATLQSRGHEINDYDRFLESFDPITSTVERIAYNDTATSRTRVPPYADRLLAAEALVLILERRIPGNPERLFDRVFIPGVRSQIGPDGLATPALGNLEKIAAVCPYGADRLTIFLLGDPPRRVVKRILRAMPGPYHSRATRGL
jgi:putative NADPH-quinone reductase